MSRDFLVVALVAAWRGTVTALWAPVSPGREEAAVFVRAWRGVIFSGIAIASGGGSAVSHSRRRSGSGTGRVGREHIVGRELRRGNRDRWRVRNQVRLDGSGRADRAAPLCAVMSENQKTRQNRRHGGANVHDRGATIGALKSFRLEPEIRVIICSRGKRTHKLGGARCMVSYSGRRRSCLLAGFIHRLGHDADIGDAGLLDGVHYSGEGAEGHTLIGPHINDAIALDPAKKSVKGARECPLTLIGWSPRKTC